MSASAAASGPAPSTPTEEPWLLVDLLVAGSGAAGLAAAVTAASKGLRVAVFEKHSHFGGTSAWSGGAMWIPGGLSNARDPDAEAYLAGVLGAEVFAKQREKISAYLTRGPAMVKHFGRLEGAPLLFEQDFSAPDFHGTTIGRVLRVQAFDGRRLGDDIKRLRLPLPEFTFLGMAIETGRELNQFLNAARSLRSAAYVLGRFKGFAGDWLAHRRSMRLVNGNALVASLLAAAMRFGVGLFPAHPVLSLIVKNKRVCGVVVDTPAGKREVRATHGLVLACGGFAHDVERIRSCFAHAPTGHEHRSAAPIENSGDGLRLGESAGGYVSPALAAPAAWAPVSLLRRRDGSTAVYPHFIERAKPGLIAVARSGERFCNEAGPYHDFVARWIEASPSDGPLQAWLICDRLFLRRYGLGVVKPASLIPWLPWLPWWAVRTGYLKVGRSIEGLARSCGIESRGLRETVRRYNNSIPLDPADSADPAFRRGETAFEKSQGDLKVRPNPCVAPIRHAPFFAVRVQPGSLGTLVGLQTDECARVLDPDGRTIPGLYACGNDMAAVMGGCYPANGVTLGAAVTFGYIAACHAAAEAPTSCETAHAVQPDAAPQAVSSAP